METTARADYYYLQIRMTKADETYHDVIIQYKDIPNIDYTPFPHDSYEKYVLSVYECYWRAREYYYYSLWAVYGNYHSIISETYNDFEKPMFYDAHTEVKEFLARGN